MEQKNPVPEREQPQGHTEGEQVSSHREDIHIRNFDIDREYNLTVEIRDSDGIVFANRYHLPAGTVETESGRVPAGSYHVTATLNDHRQTMARCEIDDTAAHTALIEIGNGTVSITTGRYPYG